MTYVLDLNRIFRTFYPTLILLLVALAWNASGQAGNLIDFKLPKMHEPSWQAPASSLGSCGDDRNIKPLTVGSCRINSEPAKLNDKNTEPTEQINSRFLVQSQTEKKTSSVRTD